MPSPSHNSSLKPHTPSKLPLPVPHSSYSTAVPFPSSPASPALEKDTSYPPTPTKIPKRALTQPLSPTVSPTRKGKTTNLKSRNEARSSNSTQETLRTFQNGYTSTDGSRYGPKLTVSGDADTLLLGLKSTMRPKLRQPLHERPANVTDLKPLPKLPKLKNSTGPVTRSNRSVVPLNDLQFVSEVATSLLRQALTSSEEKKKQKMVAIASGLVEAIVGAREAEIDTLRAREELSAAAVKVLAAKADQAKSQRRALEIGKKALKSAF